MWLDVHDSFTTAARSAAAGPRGGEDLGTAGGRAADPTRVAGAGQHLGSVPHRSAPSGPEPAADAQVDEREQERCDILVFGSQPQLCQYALNLILPPRAPERVSPEGQVYRRPACRSRHAGQSGQSFCRLGIRLVAQAQKPRGDPRIGLEVESLPECADRLPIPATHEVSTPRHKSSTTPRGRGLRKAPRRGRSRGEGPSGAVFGVI